jgi:ATP-dependent exoDNAse (exonuclease V) alpha subunit
LTLSSYSGQGKTVDQVIGSAPVSTFAQVNQAMFYVVMSRGRFSMRLFTDSKAALREAVCRPSERLSPYEILMGLTKPKERQQEREGMDVRVDRLMRSQARDRRQDREDFSARDDDRRPDLHRELIVEPER